jgi:hypothetical protein
VRVEVEPPLAFLHHPLNAADVRALLARVPPSARPDLRAVHLRTGLRDDAIEEGDTASDPHTGRHGYEVDGGLWMPLLRARSRTSPFEIDLFGFVYDDESLRAPEVQTVVLWLEEALALLLEVARACAGDDARRTAESWLVDRAVPYFREAYGAEAGAFEEWTEAHAGQRIGLERLAADTGRPYTGAAAGLLEFCARWGTADPDELRAELVRNLDCSDG